MDMLLGFVANEPRWLWLVKLPLKAIGAAMSSPRALTVGLTWNVAAAELGSWVAILALRPRR